MKQNLARAKDVPKSIRTTTINSLDDFENYDALPPELKKFFQDAPISFAAASPRAALARHPPERVLNALKRQLEAAFPGYTPPTVRPRRRR